MYIYIYTVYVCVWYTAFIKQQWVSGTIWNYIKVNPQLFFWSKLLLARNLGSPNSRPGHLVWSCSSINHPFLGVMIPILIGKSQHLLLDLNFNLLGERNWRSGACAVEHWGSKTGYQCYPCTRRIGSRALFCIGHFLRSIILTHT